MATSGSHSELLDLETKHVYDVYDEIAPHFADIQHKAWPKVRQFLKELQPGALVADVGCGNGRYLKINSRTFKLGCDRCEAFVDMTRHRGHQAIVADNLHLPYRDGVFDAVISVAVIHHFASVERRVQALRELARVLSAGGKVLICVWAFEQKHRRFDGQDVLVPWHKQSKGFRKRGTANSKSSLGTSSEFSSTSSISEDDTVQTSNDSVTEASTSRQHCSSGKADQPTDANSGQMSTIAAFCLSSIPSDDYNHYQNTIYEGTTHPKTQSTDPVLPVNDQHISTQPAARLHKPPSAPTQCCCCCSAATVDKSSRKNVASSGLTNHINNESESLRVKHHTSSEATYSSTTPKQNSIRSSGKSVPPFTESFQAMTNSLPLDLPELLTEGHGKVQPIRPTSLPLRHSSTRKVGVKCKKDRYLHDVKELKNKSVSCTNSHESVIRKKQSHPSCKPSTAVSNRERMKMTSISSVRPDNTYVNSHRQSIDIKETFTHKKEASPVFSSSTPEPVFIHSGHAATCLDDDLPENHQCPEGNSSPAKDSSFFTKLQSFFKKKSEYSTEEAPDARNLQENTFEVRWCDYYDRFVTDLEQDLESFRYFYLLARTDKGRNVLSGEFAVREFPHSSCSNVTNNKTSLTRKDEVGCLKSSPQLPSDQRANGPCSLPDKISEKNTTQISFMTNGDRSYTERLNKIDPSAARNVDNISDVIGGNGNLSDTAAAEDSSHHLCSILSDGPAKTSTASCSEHHCHLTSSSFCSSCQCSNGYICKCSRHVSDAHKTCLCRSAGKSGERVPCRVATDVCCDTTDINTVMSSDTIALSTIPDTKDSDVNGGDVFEDLTSCISACLSNLSKGAEEPSAKPHPPNGAFTAKLLSCQRYYHVFKEGELGELIREHIPSLRITQSYYDHANWCLIAEKC